MIYNYTIKIKNSSSTDAKEYDLGTIINGAKTVIKKPLCSKTYKSAAAEASFVLTGARDNVLYSSVLQSILDARSNINPYDIEITISDQSGKTIFSGYLDDANFSIITSSLPESLSLTARDKSILLDQTARLEQYYEGKTRTQLVSLLLQAVTDNNGTACSLLSSDLTDNGTDTTVSNWVITEDDKKTFRDKIDTILFEAPACVLWYDPANNGFRIVQLPSNGILEADNSKTYYKDDLVVMDDNLWRCTTTPTVGTSDKRQWELVREIRYLNSDKLTTSNGVYAKDGVLVKYPTIATRSKQNVYAENINNTIEKDEDTGLSYVSGVEVAADEFFPDAADQVATYQEYSDENLDRAYNSGESSVKNEDIALLYVKDAQLDLIASPSGKLEQYPTAIAKTGYPGHTQYFMRKAWVLLHNTDLYNSVNLTAMSITGTAVYKSVMNKMTLPEACTTPEEYETETLFKNSGETKIKQFASWLYNSKKYSCTTSSWTEIDGRFGSSEMPFSKLGDVVRVVHRVSDYESISIPHVVIQIDDQAFTTYGRVREQKVTAICLNGYSVYENVKNQIVSKSAGVDTITILATDYLYATSTTQTGEKTAYQKDIPTLSETNKYLWRKSINHYSDGSTKEIVELIGVYGDDGESAYVLQVVTSQDTFYTNKRSQVENNKVEINVRVSGYTATPTLSVVHPATLSIVDGVLTIPYNIDTTYVQVKASLIQDDVTVEDTKKLTAIDVTEYNVCLGVYTSSLPTDYNGQTILSGDFFAVGYDSSMAVDATSNRTYFEVDSVGYYTGSVYTYTGEKYIEKVSDTITSHEALTCLKAFIDGGVDLSKVSNSNYITWLKTIITDKLITNEIFAQLAEFENLVVNRKANFKGSITSSPLQTTQDTNDAQTYNASSSGLSVSGFLWSDVKTYVNKNYASSLVDETIYTASGTIDGTYTVNNVIKYSSIPEIQYIINSDCSSATTVTSSFIAPSAMVMSYDCMKLAYNKSSGFNRAKYTGGITISYILNDETYTVLSSGGESTTSTFWVDPDWPTRTYTGSISVPANAKVTVSLTAPGSGVTESGYIRVGFAPSNYFAVGVNLCLADNYGVINLNNKTGVGKSINALQVNGTSWLTLTASSWTSTDINKLYKFAKGSSSTQSHHSNRVNSSTVIDIVLEDGTYIFADPDWVEWDSESLTIVVNSKTYQFVVGSTLLRSFTINIATDGEDSEVKTWNILPQLKSDMSETDAARFSGDGPFFDLGSTDRIWKALYAQALGAAGKYITNAFLTNINASSIQAPTNGTLTITSPTVSGGSVTSTIHGNVNSATADTAYKVYRAVWN